MKNLLRPAFAVLYFLFLLSANLLAGSTGKITGKVTDAGTGDPIIGANVLVVGSMIGSTTDFDGKFTIVGAPIGSVNVRASLVGYQELIINDVKVNADQTTQINFKLNSTTVEMKGAEITAEKLVNQFATSSVQTLSSKAIEQIPNVKSVQDVVALQAGVVKMGNQMFLRGGRANEVQYVVDGIPVNNITGNSGELTATNSVNDQLQNLYAGTQAGVIGGGSAGLAVPSNTIQSVSVQTSGDADYGNSQSGIVNITTKTGGDRYTGVTQYRTDKIANTNQSEIYGAMNFSGPEPISKYLLPQLGVHLPGSLTFFVSSDMNRSDGPYNFVHNEFYNPLERKIELSGFLGGLFNGLGFRFHDNQSNSFTFNSKLTYSVGGTDELNYRYGASLGSGHNYIKDWKYRADSSAIYTNLSTQHGFSWRHLFSEKTFAILALGRVENNETNDVAGLTPPFYSEAYTGRDVDKDNINDLGTGQRWFKSKNDVWSVRLDVNSQIHPLHFLKTGFEFYYEDIKSTEILYPTVPINTANGVISPPFPPGVRVDSISDRGEYPGYGTYRWALNNFPNHGAVFLQDNIEFEGLNFHVGIRYDYLDLGKQVYDPAFIKAWKKATNATSSGLSLTEYEPQWPNRITGGSTFLYYVLHGYFSPRLSIGYPVTDRIVFYFNYGHYLQFPERDQYFKDPFILGATDNWIGNPDLRPQRTVSYEAGFENQITDDMAFGVHAFYKDIFDYATLHKLPRAANSVYTNLDFASSRGFELTGKRQFSGNFDVDVTYTYQIAKGRSSNPLASVFSPNFQLPRETRLDWDQEHTANALLRYRVGPKEEGSFFGLPFINNWSMALKWSFGSGFPYTIYKSRDTERNVLLVNNGTKPYNTRIGLSFNKGFYLLDRINLQVTLDIENLLNRRNVSSVNTFTGRPSQYGDYDPDNKLITDWYKTEYNIDPNQFDPGRQIFLGVKLDWN